MDKRYDTNVLASASIIIIRPNPRVMMAHAPQTTGRYDPVRDTRTPDTVENKEPPNEYGSILKTVTTLLYCVLQRTYRMPARVADAPRI